MLVIYVFLVLITSGEMVGLSSLHIPFSRSFWGHLCGCIRVWGYTCMRMMVYMCCLIHKANIIVRMSHKKRERQTLPEHQRWALDMWLSTQLNSWLYWCHRLQGSLFLKPINSSGLTSFCVGAGDPNPALHVCVADTLGIVCFIFNQFLSFYFSVNYFHMFLTFFAEKSRFWIS